MLTLTVWRGIPHYSVMVISYIIQSPFLGSCCLSTNWKISLISLAKYVISVSVWYGDQFFFHIQSYRFICLITIQVHTFIQRSTTRHRIRSEGKKYPPWSESYGHLYKFLFVCLFFIVCFLLWKCHQIAPFSASGWTCSACWRGVWGHGWADSLQVVLTDAAASSTP